MSFLAITINIPALWPFQLNQKQYSRAPVESSLFSLIKIVCANHKNPKLFIRHRVGTAMSFTLVKRNVAHVTVKKIVSKHSKGSVKLPRLQITQ